LLLCLVLSTLSFCLMWTLATNLPLLILFCICNGVCMMLTYRSFFFYTNALYSLLLGVSSPSFQWLLPGYSELKGSLV
jgi:hypothetical protein